MSNPARFTGALAAAVLAVASFGQTADAAYFADHVVSYDPGNATDYTDPNAALGKPHHLVSEDTIYQSVLSPFNPAWETSQLTRIGQGGHLTVQLSHYALPTAGLQLGVFVNVGLIDAGGWLSPTGQASNPAATFNAVEDSIVIEVSQDGLNFIALNNANPIVMNLPTNYYNNAGPYDVDPPANPEDADFAKTFNATLSDFDGLTWTQILDLLDGSAGGNWLDFSDTGLSQVGYVRFSLPENHPDTNADFELLALAVAHDALGSPVPEPGSAALLAAMLGAAALRRRRRAPAN